MTDETKTKKPSKKAFDMQRTDLWVADPITELCIIGGQNPDFKLPPEEWGDLDTEDDDTHALFDERVGEPMEDWFINSVDYKGVDTPIIIAKVGELACVVEGRKRVRAARIVNRRREKQGEPLLKVNCLVKRTTEVGLMATMITGNMIRSEESPETAIAKLKRLLDRGVSEEDAAHIFGKSVVTLKGWIAYDDNAIASVKKAVDSGRVSQTAASHLAKLEPEKQKAALDDLLSAPAGTKISRRTAKIAAKRTTAPTKEEGVGDRRTQKKLLKLMKDLPHPGATEKTMAFWQGAEDMLALILGNDDADERLVAVLAKLRAEEK